MMDIEFFITLFSRSILKQSFNTSTNYNVDTSWIRHRLCDSTTIFPKKQIKRKKTKETETYSASK